MFASEVQVYVYPAPRHNRQQTAYRFRPSNFKYDDATSHQNVTVEILVEIFESTYL